MEENSGDDWYAFKEGWEEYLADNKDLKTNH